MPFCPSCGSKLEAAARFCGECGANVTGIGDAASAANSSAEPKPAAKKGAIGMVIGIIIALIAIGFVREWAHGWGKDKGVKKRYLQKKIAEPPLVR